MTRADVKKPSCAHNPIDFEIYNAVSRSLEFFVGGWHMARGSSSRRHLNGEILRKDAILAHARRTYKSRAHNLQNVDWQKTR